VEPGRKQGGREHTAIPRIGKDIHEWSEELQPAVGVSSLGNSHGGFALTPPVAIHSRPKVGPGHRLAQAIVWDIPTFSRKLAFPCALTFILVKTQIGSKKLHLFYSCFIYILSRTHIPKNS